MTPQTVAAREALEAMVRFADRYHCEMRTVSADEALAALGDAAAEALSALDAGPVGVRVKPLEWHEKLKAGERSGFICSTVGVLSYTIMLSRFRVYGIPGEHDGAAEFPSLEAAKAAAQADYERRILSALSEPTPAYQARVHEWMMACFNDEIAFSIPERNHRFLEEALELVQAQGCTKSEAYQLVDYVFGRAVGDPKQEVGGVQVCLAALCTASGIDMDEAGETELARIWTKVEQIRTKHAAKPQFSPLPGPTTAPETRT